MNNQSALKYGLLVLFMIASIGTTEAKVAGVQYVTATAASSPCIGDFRTPFCAVETIIACLNRVRTEECKPAWVPYVSSSPDRERRVEYRILNLAAISLTALGKLQLSGRNFLSEDPQNNEVSEIRAGDVQAKVAIRACPKRSRSCDGYRWQRGVIAIAEDTDGWMFATYVTDDPGFFVADEPLPLVRLLSPDRQ